MRVSMILAFGALTLLGFSGFGAAHGQSQNRLREPVTGEADGASTEEGRPDERPSTPIRPEDEARKFFALTQFVRHPRMTAQVHLLARRKMNDVLVAKLLKVKGLTPKRLRKILGIRKKGTTVTNMYKKGTMEYTKNYSVYSAYLDALKRAKKAQQAAKRMRA